MRLRSKQCFNKTTNHNETQLRLCQKCCKVSIMLMLKLGNTNKSFGNVFHYIIDFSVSLSLQLHLYRW